MAAQTSPTSNSLSLRFPIPQANTASIDVATINAKVPTGKTLAPLTVRTTGDPHLQNESIVYLIQSPSKPTASATYKVYALIEYTRQVRKVQAAAAAVGGTLDAVVKVADAAGELRQVRTVSGLVSPAYCPTIAFFDDLFESGQTIERNYQGKGSSYGLFSALPASEQGSPPEEVLDNLIANGWKQSNCSGAPEGDDSGPK